MSKTTRDRILARIRKLLSLANAPSATEGEAANAAAAAQALMTRYQIDEISIDLDESGPEPDNIRAWEDPLEQGRMLAAWKGQLAMAVAAVNSCQIFRDQDGFRIIGEQRDAQSVRYLYAYLVREVDALAGRYAGNGRTWINNWRHGVVDTLRDRLRAARDEALRDVYAEAKGAGTALVVIDNALAVVKRRESEVARIASVDLGLRSSKGHSARAHLGAQAQGRRDGRSISLGGGSSARIGGGSRRITG